MPHLWILLPLPIQERIPTVPAPGCARYSEGERSDPDQHRLLSPCGPSPGEVCSDEGADIGLAVKPPQMTGATQRAAGRQPGMSCVARKPRFFMMNCQAQEICISTTLLSNVTWNGNIWDNESGGTCANGKQRVTPRLQSPNIQRSHSSCATLGKLPRVSQLQILSFVNGWQVISNSKDSSEGSVRVYL